MKAYDAIKYDGAEPYDILPTLEMIYGVDIDNNNDGKPTLGRLSARLEDLPRRCMCCLDWEHFYPQMIRARLNPKMMRRLIEKMEQVLRFCQKQRRDVKFGFWGWPLRVMLTDQDWRSRHAHEWLTWQQDVLFPSCYLQVGEGPGWASEMLLQLRRDTRGGKIPIVAVISVRAEGKKPQPVSSKSDFDAHLRDVSTGTGLNGVALWDSMHDADADVQKDRLERVKNIAGGT